MTKQEFASRLQNACAAVTAAEQELTEIDSRFGDADHGLTMSKITKAISAAAGESEGGIQAMLDLSLIHIWNHIILFLMWP